MLRAIRPGSTFDFIPKECRDLPEDDPNRVVFKLKHLSVDELAEVEDSIGAYDSHDETMKVKVGTQMLTALRLGLRGWQNFLFDDGTEALFETREAVVRKKGPASRDDKRRVEHVPTDETLGLIPSPIRTEIANAITEGNKLTDDKKGN